MLKIKLARFGRRGQPHFRIVVNEARSKRDGQYMALLGQYAPAQQPKILEIDIKAFKEWLAKGAQPTPTVASLFKRFQTKDPFPLKKPQPSKKQLAKKAALEQAKTETKAEVKPEEKVVVKETIPEVKAVEADNKPVIKTDEVKKEIKVEEKVAPKESQPTSKTKEVKEDKAQTPVSDQTPVTK